MQCTSLLECRHWLGTQVRGPIDLYIELGSLCPLNLYEKDFFQYSCVIFAKNNLTSTADNFTCTHATNKILVYSESWDSSLNTPFSGIKDQSMGSCWKWRISAGPNIANQVFVIFAKNNLCLTADNFTCANATNKLFRYSESWVYFLYFLFSGINEQSTGTWWKFRFSAGTIVTD